MLLWPLYGRRGVVVKLTFTVSTRDVSIECVGSGKYTVLLGDSGTGKTRLAKICGLVAQGAAKVEPTSLHIIGIAEDIPFPMQTLETSKRAIFVIDEHHLKQMRDAGQLEKLLKSNNFFIFITRDCGL